MLSKSVQKDRNRDFAEICRYFFGRITPYIEYVVHMWGTYYHLVTIIIIKNKFW